MRSLRVRLLQYHVENDTDRMSDSARPERNLAGNEEVEPKR